MTELIVTQKLYKGRGYFDWNKITKETTTERINAWLYPITQNPKYDFVLDVLQQNIDYVINCREKAFESICQYFKIDLILFYKAVEEIHREDIFEKEEINYNEFLDLLKRLNIKPTRLNTSIGIYSSLYQKLRKGEIKTARIINMKLKHKIQLIKLDIEYMNKYKIVYYSSKKLENLCQSRNSSLDNFLKFLDKNPKHYEFNKLIIQNINKIWLGQTKIPNEFITENHNELHKRIERKANYIVFLYNCRHIKKDLIQNAFLEIYEKYGNIVKNFYFNKELMLNILAKKAMYIMLRLCKLEKREQRNLYYDKFENPEHSLIIADYKYNPENLFI